MSNPSKLDTEFIKAHIEIAKGVRGQAFTDCEEMINEHLRTALENSSKLGLTRAIIHNIPNFYDPLYAMVYQYSAMKMQVCFFVFNNGNSILFDWDQDAIGPDYGVQVIRDCDSKELMIKNLSELFALVKK